jgi:integrase
VKDCPLVFQDAGQPIHRRAFHKAWTAAREAAQMPHSIPHDMRRSAVRNLERAGIPRKVAMQMVGHRTESIYRRYHIVAEADIHEAGARLDGAAFNVRRRKPSSLRVLQGRKTA